jgi:hypothetical protein
VIRLGHAYFAPRALIALFTTCYNLQPPFSLPLLSPFAVLLGAAPAASSAPAASKSSKPSKPEKEKKEKAAPKKAAAAAAAGEAEGPVGKLPTAKSAYMLFADDKRTQVKGESALLSEIGMRLA